MTFLRWYDTQPNLSKAARLLFLFPDEVQTIISQAVMLLVDKEFRENERQHLLKSLGREKVLGLHKSKNRRREYDHNEQLHQAMNYLFVLSDEKRSFMADHILKMIEYIQHYFEICNIAQVKANLDDVATITRTYVATGGDEVEAFLNRLRQEFLQNVRAGKPPGLPLKIDFKANVGKQDGSGMKISKLE